MMINNQEAQQYNQVKFLELSLQARSNALNQIAEINNQEGLQDASTAEEFKELIINGYNPDRDYMFLQYPNDDNKVTVYLKDFS